MYVSQPWTFLSCSQTTIFFADALRLRSQKSHRDRKVPASGTAPTTSTYCLPCRLTGQTIKISLYSPPSKQHKLGLIPPPGPLADRNKDNTFLFQRSGSAARLKDRFLSKGSPLSECQWLILGLNSKASEIITPVDVREQWEAWDLGGSRSETRCSCQQEHSLGTNKENT